MRVSQTRQKLIEQIFHYLKMSNVHPNICFNLIFCKKHFF